MHGYIQGITRILNPKGYKVSINKENILINQPTALKQVMDNHFAGQQANGAIPFPHNVLVLPDIKKVISHRVCAMSHASGYLNRLVFVIGLMIGLKPTAMA